MVLTASQAKVNTTAQVGHSNGTPELSNGLGRAQKSTHRASAGTLAVDNDLRSVSTEAGDVLNDPLHDVS